MGRAEELFGVEVEINTDVQTFILLVIVIESVEVGRRIHRCHTTTHGLTRLREVVARLAEEVVSFGLRLLIGFLSVELLLRLALVHLQRLWHPLPKRGIVNVAEDASLDAVVENFVLFGLVANLRVGLWCSRRLLPCHDKIVEVFVPLEVEVRIHV